MSGFFDVEAAKAAARRRRSLRAGRQVEGLPDTVGPVSEVHCDSSPVCFESSIGLDVQHQNSFPGTSRAGDVGGDNV